METGRTTLGQNLRRIGKETVFKMGQYRDKLNRHTSSSYSKSMHVAGDMFMRLGIHIMLLVAVIFIFQSSNQISGQHQGATNADRDDPLFVYTKLIKLEGVANAGDKYAVPATYADRKINGAVDPDWKAHRYFEGCKETRHLLESSDSQLETLPRSIKMGPKTMSLAAIIMLSVHALILIFSILWNCMNKSLTTKSNDVSENLSVEMNSAKGPREAEEIIVRHGKALKNRVEQAEDWLGAAGPYITMVSTALTAFFVAAAFVSFFIALSTRDNCGMDETAAAHFNKVPGYEAPVGPYTQASAAADTKTYCEAVNSALEDFEANPSQTSYNTLNALTPNWAGGDWDAATATGEQADVTAIAMYQLTCMGAAGFDAELSKSTQSLSKALMRLKTKEETIIILIAVCVFFLMFYMFTAGTVLREHGTKQRLTGQLANASLSVLTLAWYSVGLGALFLYLSNRADEHHEEVGNWNYCPVSFAPTANLEFKDSKDRWKNLFDVKGDDKRSERFHHATWALSLVSILFGLITSFIFRNTAAHANLFASGKLSSDANSARSAAKYEGDPEYYVKSFARFLYSQVIVSWPIKLVAVIYGAIVSLAIVYLMWPIATSSILLCPMTSDVEAARDAAGYTLAIYGAGLITFLTVVWTHIGFAGLNNISRTIMYLMYPKLYPTVDQRMMIRFDAGHDPKLENAGALARIRVGTSMSSHYM